MIIVMSPNATKEQIENVEKKLLELGFKTHPIVGDVKTVIGAIGDKDFSIPTPYPPCPELKALFQS